MTRRRLDHVRETNRGSKAPRRFLPAAAALLFALGGMGTALADIPEPPPADDDDEDEKGVCLPEKEPGDECTLPSGDDGVCQDETQPCGFDGGGTIWCHVCEDEGCSIAGVGMGSPAGPGWIALGALAALGLAGRRRRGR